MSAAELPTEKMMGFVEGAGAAGVKALRPSGAALRDGLDPAQRTLNALDSLRMSVAGTLTADSRCVALDLVDLRDPHNPRQIIPNTLAYPSFFR